MLLLAISSLCLAHVVYTASCLLRNYLIARKVGMPIRIIPIDPENPLWMVFDKRFFIPLFERLPFGPGSFTRFNWRGWEFADKYRAHEEMGDVFMMVTPGRLWVHLCDPEALNEVLRRDKEFPRPLEIFEMTKIFGDNLSTVDSQSWPKHRRITSVALNEQNNGLVWAEAVRQSHDAVQYWASQEEVTSTADDNRTLSLHILSAAGFGKSYPFEPSQKSAKPATPNSHAATTYREALQTILDNCLILFVFGTKFIQNQWLPQKLRKLNAAVQSFQASMTQQYEAEKQALSIGTPTSNNLMTQLIRASLGADGLSESEVYGNMFIFNFAGHDTTAHALTFTIFLLATAPEVQAWVAEELQHVLGSAPPEEWEYTKGFPRLKRTLALMLETLRLFPPVPIAKSTGMTDSALMVRGRRYVIPANTLLIPNHVAVHTHPKIWGEGSLVFDPQRWITQVDGDESIDSEVVVTPRKGSFVPWSEGVRNCPGKKFSQVEFVACLATMLRDYHVVPKVSEGESVEEARERVLRLVEEDTGQVLLLQMLHPERAPLVWRRRS